MNNRPAEVVIFDIGHGNTALVAEQDYVTVIDLSPAAAVLDALRRAEVGRINQVVISHADADHCGGLIGVLLDPDVAVDVVWLNTDLAKKTVTWEGLKRAVTDARQRGEVKVLPGLGTDHGVIGGHQAFRVEVIAPNPMLILGGGPGSKDSEGREITTNAMSVVVRVWRKDEPLVLFAADIDELGLDYLLGDVPEPRARILVFPHHGGLPGKGNPQVFAERLCRVVQPEIVVFSIGRGKFDTPRPEIIDGVRRGAPQARIMCTQLSATCAARLPGEAATHLSDHLAQGAATNACCAGSIQLRLDGDLVLGMPNLEAHQRFVQLNTQSPLCGVTPERT